jgi:hypothetical protein
MLKTTCRMIGALNLVLCAIGIYMMCVFVFRVIQRHQPDPAAPYFGVAFTALTLLNVFFVSALILSAVQLVRLKPNAVRTYCITVGVCLLYFLLIGWMWTPDSPVSRSVAAATGVGNMGIAPFMIAVLPVDGLMVPGAYPIVSAAVLLVVQKRASQKSNQSVVQHA